jgi:hypothetical protein
MTGWRLWWKLIPAETLAVVPTAVPSCSEATSAMILSVCSPNFSYTRHLVTPLQHFLDALK